MNTKIISLVIVILIVVSGVFVFKKSEVKKENTDIDTNNIVNNVDSNNADVQTRPEVQVQTKPSESVKTDSQTSTPINKSEPVVSSLNNYIGGIVITSFKPNDLIKLPLNVEGYLTGKGWAVSEGEVGNVEIFDANGKSISNVAILRSITDWMKYPVYFKASVGDREMMSYIKTDTGIVKLSSSEQRDGKSLRTISIPVRFK